MRFGILGYGGIAQRFVHDSAQVEEAEITWIASQTPAKREAAAARRRRLRGSCLIFI